MTLKSHAVRLDALAESWGVWDDGDDNDVVGFRQGLSVEVFSPDFCEMKCQE